MCLFPWMFMDFRILNFESTTYCSYSCYIGFRRIQPTNYWTGYPTFRHPIISSSIPVKPHQIPSDDPYKHIEIVLNPIQIVSNPIKSPDAHAGQRARRLRRGRRERPGDGHGAKGYNIYMCVYVCVCVNMYVCLYGWMDVCMHACMHACLCMYIYVCVNVCVHEKS